jgi:hypothetical protein
MITLNELKEIINQYDAAPKQHWSEYIFSPPLIRNLKIVIALIETQKNDMYDDIILSHENVFQLITQVDLFYDGHDNNDGRTNTLRNNVASTFNKHFTAEIIKILTLLRRDNLLDQTNYNGVAEMSKKGANSYIDILWQCMLKLDNKQFFNRSNYLQLTQNYENITGIYSLLSLFVEVNAQYPRYRLFNQPNLDAIFQYADIFNDSRVRWVIDNFKANAKAFTADVFKKTLERCKSANGDREVAVNAVCNYLTEIADIQGMYLSNLDVIMDTAGIMNSLNNKNIQPIHNLYYMLTGTQKESINSSQLKKENSPKSEADLPPLARYFLHFQQKNSSSENNAQLNVENNQGYQY